jgi:hypothetical protein
MFEVLIRALLGWMALSCASVAGWSLLVTRFKRATSRRAGKVYQLPPARTRQVAA